MLLLIFIMEICLTLSIASRRNLLGILSGFLFVIVCYYLMRTVPRKIRESVEKGKHLFLYQLCLQRKSLMASFL